MIAEADLFTSLAEIAGVFVGFGALIAAVSSTKQTGIQKSRVQGIVVIGLLVVVASLIPVGIASYGVDSRGVWLYSSVCFLILIWAALAVSLRSDSFKSASPVSFSNHPVGFIAFWIALEVPIQVPLFLVAGGMFEELAPAFYSTALILNLFEAAFLLALLVFSPEK